MTSDALSTAASDGQCSSVERNDDCQTESWVSWLRRTTHEAAEAMTKVGVPDWVEEQRRRQWR